MEFFNETQNLHSSTSSPALRIFKATGTGVLMVLSIFTNSLTLAILPKVREHNSVTRVFMTSMTISDLAIGCFYMPPILVATITDTWPFGDTICGVLGYLNIVLSFVSNTSLLALNFDRYLAVTRPYQYPTLMTQSRARIISFCIWLCALTMSALNCFMPGRSVYYSKTMHTCTTGPNDPSAADIRGTVFMIVFIIVPFGMTLTMFIRLFVLARFHAAEIAMQMRAVAKKSDKKAFTTFFIMTVCLAVWWTPLTAVFVHENITRKEMSSWFVCFAQMTASFNTITNVLVYYLRNTGFRQTAKRVTVSLIPCMNAVFDTPVIQLDSST